MICVVVEDEGVENFGYEIAGWFDAAAQRKQNGDKTVSGKVTITPGDS